MARPGPVALEAVRIPDAGRGWTRRAVLAGAGALASGSVLAACAGGAPATRRGTVRLLLVGTGDISLYQQMLPRFETAHPGITVRLTMASPGPKQSLTTSLLGGGGPDVFWISDPAPYLGRPLLLDLSGPAARDGFDLTAFSPPVLASCRQGGSLFLLPRSVSPGAYAVRTDIFAAAGLDVPTGGYTDQDLADTWRRLTGQGRTGGDLVWSPTSSFYLTGWGASLVDAHDPLRAGLGSAEAVACGQWMWDRFWRDDSARGLQGQNATASLLRGTLAMKVVSCAGVPPAAGAYQSISWRLAPFPRWPAAPATFADMDYYGIAATTAHPAEAWLLLSYLASSEWESAAITASLVCPARTALWPAYLAAARRAAPPLAQQPMEVFSTALEQGYALPTARFPYQVEALAVLQPLWQQMFGVNHTLTVEAGFPQAAAALAKAELAASAGGSPVP